MYRSILDGKIYNPIYDFLVEYEHLLEMAKIPNPIEDIIDSIFACKILKKNIKEC